MNNGNISLAFHKQILVVMCNMDIVKSIHWWICTLVQRSYYVRK